MAASAEFTKAAEDVKGLKATPSDDQKLKLYGLYKRGLDEDFAAAKKPGMLDFTGKAKYGAWKSVVDEGITAEQAQEKYIALVEELKKQHGFDA